MCVRACMHARARARACVCAGAVVVVVVTDGRMTGWREGDG